MGKKRLVIFISTIMVGVAIYGLVNLKSELDLKFEDNDRKDIMFSIVKKEDTPLKVDEGDEEVLNTEVKNEPEETEKVLPIIDENKESAKSIINDIKSVYQNSDIIGVIEVTNSNILYPLVQGTDNEEYLYLNSYKRNSSNGSIFLDSSNNQTMEDRRSIIYGHNMKNGNMFGSLKRLDFRNRKVIITLVNGEVLEYKPLATLNINPDDRNTYIGDKYDTMMDFFDTVKENALEWYDGDLTEDSKSLTLITCKGAGSKIRYGVVCVR